METDNLQQPVNLPETSAEPACETPPTGDSEAQSPTAPEPCDLPEKSLEQLLAEAEQRGYLRGRNEAIALEMQVPAEWENLTADDLVPLPRESPSKPLILNNARRSVWDD